MPWLWLRTSIVVPSRRVTAQDGQIEACARKERKKAACTRCAGAGVSAVVSVTMLLSRGAARGQPSTA